MIASESTWGDEEPTWPTATLGKRVLVAEDHAAMRELLMLVLAERGYDVDSVSNGSEMIRLLSESSPDGSLASRFDLIITDLRMPGVSGLDAVDRLRRDGNRTPVIAVTAFPHDSTRTRAQSLEIQLLAKPFDLDTFRDAVHAALGSTLAESCSTLAESCSTLAESCSTLAESCSTLAESCAVK
jgi:CheY-like chemotaxis protein